MGGLLCGLHSKADILAALGRNQGLCLLLLMLLLLYICVRRSSTWATCITVPGVASKREVYGACVLACTAHALRISVSILSFGPVHLA